MVPLGLKRWAAVDGIIMLLLSKKSEYISEMVVNNVHPLCDFY